MMTVCGSTQSAYETMKRFLDLGDDDSQRLQAFLPRIRDRLPEITDQFYTKLELDERLKPLLEGRLEHLKKTHVQWLERLFSGDYGSAFCEEQFRVGFVHVRVDLDSMWVDAVTSFLRKDLQSSVLEVSDSPEEASEVFGSLLKVIDLALMTINLAYNQHRMKLLHEATGMPSALLERLIRVSVGS